ncbi:MAG: hypothetical protein HOP18_20460 [Deltaproteobacteria bacterium]|nr:hypothetical protein [Deltaproteobacteria bacterium]
MVIPYKKLFVATAFLVGLSSAAHGAGGGNPAPGREIFTPTLQKADTEVFTCRAVNTGKLPNAIDIVVLSSKGVPLETQKSVLLQPGETTSDSSKTKNTIGYCRVTAKTSPNNILVTLCSQPFTNGSCQAAVTGQ